MSLVIDVLTATWDELVAGGGTFATTVQEVRGQQLRVFTAAPPHMRYIWEASARHGDRPYIVFEDERFTYAEAHAIVRSLAHTLATEHGVGVNAWWTTAELKYSLTDSRPKVVVVDDDQFVHIVDRAKDMVLRGGENVYCAEVEAAIYKHPDIAEAAVFGVPDERLGEAVGVAIHLVAGATLDQTDLTAFLAESIAKYKVPEHVWFMAEPLPQNANGKFLKHDLQKSLVATNG